MPPPIAQALAVLRADAVMRPLVDSIALSPILPTNDLFSSLCQSIVSQQLNVKAAATIYSRLTSLFPQKQLFPELVLATDNDALCRIGLSGQKAHYIKEAAQRWLNDGLSYLDWDSMSDEDIISTLTRIKGVGVWTVQMLLIFDLDRQDVFPSADFGIRDAMIRLYRLDASPDKSLLLQLEEIATRWRPYRSLACRYLWRWRDDLLRSKD